MIDFAIYGGSCLILVSNFRISSEDVDAVALEVQAFVDDASRKIATRRAWPEDWLNDGVLTYLSSAVEGRRAHELLAEVAERLSADRAALHVAMAGFLDTFYTQPEGGRP